MAAPAAPSPVRKRPRSPSGFASRDPSPAAAEYDVDSALGSASQPPTLKRIRVRGPTPQGHARYLAATDAARTAALALVLDQQPSQGRAATTPSQASTDKVESPLVTSGASDSSDAALAGGVEHAAEVRAPAVESLVDISDEVFTAAMTSLLEQLVTVNEKSGLARTCDDVDESLHLFFSRQLQTFSLESYVDRIVAHIPSRQVFVTALAYIDRIFEGNNDMALSPANMHRVFTVAVLIAYKWLEDEPCSQDFFRSIGGIPSLDELNELEKRFLNQIRWRGFVQASLYESYYQTVLARVNILHPNGVPFVAPDVDL